MKFESAYIEKKLNRDYFGFSEAYIDGEGFRREKFSENPQGKITVIKGDDPEMINEFDDLGEAIESYIEEKCEPEFYELEKKLSEINRKALVEAVNILSYYKEEITKNPKLKTALLTLVKFVGFGAGSEKYPVKKELEKEPEIFNWKSFIEHIDNEDIEEEIEKNLDPSDKFPTLTKNLIAGQRKRDKALSERDVSMGRRFI